MAEKKNASLKREKIRIDVETDELDALLLVLEKYKNALNKMIEDSLKSGEKRFYSSSEIDPSIYSRCRVCAAIDAIQICRNAEKDIRRRTLAGEKEVAFSDYLVVNPLCTWNKNGYKVDDSGFYMGVIDNSVGVKRKIKYIHIIPKLTEKQKKTLLSTQCGNITIEYVDGKLSATICYQSGGRGFITTRGYKTAGKDKISEDVHLKLSDAMVEDLKERGRLNQFYKGFTDLIRNLALHPLIVVKQRMTTKVEIESSDIADCVEVFLGELNIPFIRDGNYFTTNLSEWHLRTMCRYYIGSKESFFNARKTPDGALKRRCVGFAKEDGLYIKDIIRSGEPYYLDRIAFYPFVVNESVDIHSLEVTDPKVADRFENILMENKIKHEWEGNVFRARIAEDDLKMILNIAGPKPVKQDVVPTEKLRKWVLDNYGISIHNQVYSAIKMKYNFNYRKYSRDEEKKKSMSISREKEIACLRAFAHFGMMTKEEAEGYIKRL